MDIIAISKHAIPFLIKGLYMTAYLALISGILAVLIGIIGGILGTSKVFLFKWVYSMYVNIFRGTPFLMQLYIIYFVLPSLPRTSVSTTLPLSLSI